MDIQQFIDTQLQSWPMAKANFEALKNVEVRNLNLDGMPLKVQFNPARMVSSAAKVDAASLKARPCFLCDKNRPAEQIGIDWKDGKYTVLINPFPIFPRHLTIPATEHTIQKIEGRMTHMIELTQELNGYTVFYNGPHCGASAPDHMHFQAGNSDFLTIQEAIEDAELKTVTTEGDSTLSVVDSMPLKLFVIDAATPAEGEKLFDKLLAAMPIPEGEYEPMMNILSWNTPAGVRVAVVPRKRHRPSFYGMENEDQMLISPASVDMGGVYITPRPQDFERFDAETVRKLIDELTLSKEEIDAIAGNVN